MENKDFLKQLGLKLKCQRIMKEISVQVAAKNSGLHTSTILEMEKGLTDFHILNLKRLSEVYGIEMKEIF